MTTLGEAFQKVRSDDALAKQFTQDPAGVMQRLGVDTSNLKVTKTETVAPKGVASAADISGCVSIGCIVCASIG